MRTTKMSHSIQFRLRAPQRRPTDIDKLYSINVFNETTSYTCQRWTTVTGQYLITFPIKTHTICHKARHPAPLSLFHICSLTLLLLISPSLSFFLFMTQPLSCSLALINSTGLPSDAFQAPSSYHRPGLGRRPEGY